MWSMRPLLNHSHDDDQVEADPPLAQHGLGQPRAPWSNLGQTTRRCGHGGRPRCPAIPAQPHDCLPRCHAPRPFRSDAADAEGTDTGRHTGRLRPDTGHLDAQTPAPDTGQRSVGQPPVGHWTLSPDTDADRATTAQPASDLLGLLAERPHAGTPSRVSALALPGSRWVAPLAGPRLGALLSSDDYGSSVERKAHGQVLWRVQMWRLA